MKLFLISAILCLLIGAVVGRLFPYEPRRPLDGRDWPPGSPWPLPLEWTPTDTVLSFDPSTFRIVALAIGIEDCEPLEFAVSKYNNDFLFPTIEGIRPVPDVSMDLVIQLGVLVTGDSTGNTECTSYPRLANNTEYEHYLLDVNANGVAFIQAQTVWGALRGMETFSQLIWSNENYEEDDEPLHFYVNATSINDYPRYPHRGLMIDTARHYEPEHIFYKLMDGMLYNKLNVLHWHVTDDQSFPFVSRTFPELSEEGAYTGRHIYPPEMVQRVIEAGRLRGIRVLLEFDTPGHTHSWGNAHPELLTPCYGSPGIAGTPNPGEHAARENLNPMNEFTYNFTQQFFTEIVQEVQQDQFVHLGMDEVYPACWQSSPEIAEFMRINGYTSIAQVQEHYTTRHIDMIKSLGATPIIWQDPLDAGVNIDQDVMIQVWKDWGPNWQYHMQSVLNKGYKTLLSAPWYINYINYGESWVNYYQSDPVLSLPSITDPQKELIYGGEACIWGEFVDKTNILSRLFPFVSAIAERLWSHDIPISYASAMDARKRLDIHRCRLLQRKLPAQPILNGFCGAWELVD